MHAVLITYISAASLEDVRESYTEFAHALASGQSSGFISKTWLYNGDTHGGFHLFRDREAADRYLSEMIEPNFSGDPSISNIRVERFEINEELSSLTHGLATGVSPAA